MERASRSSFVQATTSRRRAFATGESSHLVRTRAERVRLDALHGGRPPTISRAISSRSSRWRSTPRSAPRRRRQPDARTPLLIDVRVRSRLSRTAESGNPTVVTAESVSRQELPDHRPGWRDGVSPWQPSMPRPGRRHRRCRRGVKSPQAVERWAFAQRAVSESLGTARCAPITCRAAATTGPRTTGSCAICCTAAVFRPDCRPLSARKSSSTLRLLLRLLDRSFIVGG